VTDDLTGDGDFDEDSALEAIPETDRDYEWKRVYRACFPEGNVPQGVGSRRMRVYDEDDDEEDEESYEEESEDVDGYDDDYYDSYYVSGGGRCRRDGYCWW